ncbi:MAG: hypothetical protein CL916_05335 [Deltaproteobacteria bacterium]|nr:hypothetical protein [Deltaproteobacteria bacterium]
MNEFFVRNRLSEYIDGTLSPQEEKIVQEALETNKELYEEYISLKEAVDMLSQFGSIQPSRNLAPLIMEQLQDMPANNNSFFRTYAPQLAAAVACLLIITALLLPEKKTSNTISASVVHTPPKSRPLQLPQKLSNTLIENEMDVTKIALASEEDPSDRKNKKVLSTPNKKKTRVARRIEPLVIDQPTSRTDSPYLLFMDDPQILFKLESLAKSNNSILTQRDGSSLKPYSMSDGKSSQVLKMSANAQNISAIEEALRQLGAEFHQFSSPKSDEKIQIQLNIQFE